MLTKGSNKKKNISSNIISSLNPKNLFTVSNEIVSKFEKKKKPFKANNQVNTKLNNESPETLESTITTTTSVSSAFISRAFISKMSKIISLI
jgi:L-rhamnose isomerase